MKILHSATLSLTLLLFSGCATAYNNIQYSKLPEVKQKEYIASIDIDGMYTSNIKDYGDKIKKVAIISLSTRYKIRQPKYEDTQLNTTTFSDMYGHANYSIERYTQYNSHVYITNDMLMAIQNRIQNNVANELRKAGLEVLDVEKIKSSKVLRTSGVGNKSGVTKGFTGKIVTAYGGQNFSDFDEMKLAFGTSYFNNLATELEVDAFIVFTGEEVIDLVPQNFSSRVQTFQLDADMTMRLHLIIPEKTMDEAGFSMHSGFVDTNDPFRGQIQSKYKGTLAQATEEATQEEIKSTAQQRVMFWNEFYEENNFLMMTLTKALIYHHFEDN